MEDITVILSVPRADDELPKICIFGENPDYITPEELKLVLMAFLYAVVVNPQQDMNSESAAAIWLTVNYFLQTLGEHLSDIDSDFTRAIGKMSS